ARGDVLLLNVCVEGVKKHAYVRMVHLIGKKSGIGRSIEEVRLKPVQRLDCERDAVGCKSVRHRLIPIYSPLPLIGRAPPSRQVAYGRIKRADDKFGPGLGGGLTRI